MGLKIDICTLENSLRYIICTAIGCAFAIWADEFPENVLPPGQGFLVALLCSCLSFPLPHVMAIIGLYPSILVLVLTIGSVASAFLAASTVSKGLLVAVYSMVSLFASTFYFGKEVYALKAFVAMFCGVGAMFTLSLLPGVEANGLSFVSDIWKTGGFIHNLFLVLGWVLAILTVSLILPLSKDHLFPSVTHLVSRKLLPGCLEACGNILEGSIGLLEITATKAPSEEMLLKNLQTLERLQQTLNGGAVANLAIFEIRLFRAPLQETSKYLAELTKCVDAIIVSTFEIALLLKEGGVMFLEAVPMERKKAYLDSIKICAKALKEGKPNDELTSLLQDMGKWEKHDSNARRNAKALLKTTFVWLEAYNNPSSTKHSDNVHHLANAAAISCLALFVVFAKKVAQFSKYLVHPTNISWRHICYSLKLTAGYVVLLCMSLYWDAWANLRIQTGVEEVGAVFSGWALLGYSMSWLISKEGTLKKGTQRILGTMTGGFLAWLAPIVCSGQRHPDPGDINRVGYFFYLILILMIVAYLTYPQGLASYFGPDKSHGAFGMYVILTLILIGLEIQNGKASGDDLVANRVVATLTGVAMSIVVAVLPPNMAGGDVCWARQAYDKQREAFKRIVHTFLIQAGKLTKETDSTEEGVSEVNSLLAEAADKRKYALMLYQDANQLRSIPIWNPDPAILKLIQSLHINEFILENMQDYANQNLFGTSGRERSSTPADVESSALETAEQDALTQLQQLYDSMSSGDMEGNALMSSVETEKGPVMLTLPVVKSTDVQDRASDISVQGIAAAVAILNKRFADHQKVLNTLITGGSSDSTGSKPALKTRIET